MLTSDLIRKKAHELGADIVGIGDIARFDGVDPQRDPRYILPRAKSIIGMALHIPCATYIPSNIGSQYYSLTSVGIKNTAEDQMVVLLLKMARVIENEGYEAVLQRDLPNLRPRGDEGVNPELEHTTVMDFARAVGPGKPAPDVMIDFGYAAQICGMGAMGRNGKILTPEFGPYQRFSFIVTNANLEADARFSGSLCDDCGECAENCPGHAIDMDNGLDEWQCSVYYRGAHRSNPFITGDFLQGRPDREDILDGKKRFTRAEAIQIREEMQFLPNTKFNYVPCLCGRKCETSCYTHLKSRGLLKGCKEETE